MKEMISSEFQKSGGTALLVHAIDANEPVMVIARNGCGGKTARAVKLTHDTAYKGASISMRDLKAGGVSAMIKQVDGGNEYVHARINGTKFFKMEVVVDV